jgi:hypothetical protein
MYTRGDKKEGLYRARLNSGLGNYGLDGLVDFDTGLDPTGMGKAVEEAIAAGSATASKYITQAKDYLGKFTASGGNKSDADIAQYFFLQGLDTLEGGTKYLQQAGAIGGEEAKKAAASFTALRDGIKAGFHLGSGEGGSLDKIKDVDTMIKSTITIANMLGAREDVTALIQQWGSVATGCASMLVSAGPVWGGIGCAFSAVFTALSMKAPSPETTPPGMPFAQLVLSPNVFNDHPEISQLSMVARDAMLLASVLRHHYGLTTSTPLWEALTWANSMPHSSRAPLTPEQAGKNELWGRTVNVFSGYHNFLAKDNPVAKPVVDLTSMLLAVSALDRTEPVNFGQTTADLVQIARVICDHGDWDEACHCDWDKDGNGPCGAITQASHEHQLALGYYIGQGMLNQAGIATGASIGRGRIANKQPVGSLLPFIRVDELINYFCAVSLNTRRQDDQMWQLEVARFLTPTTPIRFWFIPAQSKAVLWSYTNIMCAPEQCGSPKEFYVNKNKSAADDLRGRLVFDPGGKDVEAQREYAALRLMAAMSYLIWMERADQNNTSYAKTRADLIATGPQNAPFSVAWQAQMPIDPRQVVQVAPHQYVANTFGGRHPWDTNLGAEIKHYSVESTNWDWATTAGVHFSAAYRSHSTRDGRWLHEWIQQREAYYRDIIANAHRAALAVIEGGSGSGLQIAPLFSTSLPLTSTVAAMAAGGYIKIQQMLIEQGKGPQLLSVTKAEFKTNCERDGGYVVQDIDPYTKTLRDFCRPTSVTEADCRANGGTPTWDTVNGYKCVPAGAGGGGAGGIVLLAGAALLLAKFLK